MNPTETNSENIVPSNVTNETTQVNPVVSPPPSLEVPTPAQSTTSQQSSSVSTPSSGLTSFPSNESSSVNANPVETIAKKEVVTRPLLWGVVTFLFFTGLVIGGVSLWRLYREQNSISSDTMDTTTPSAVTESTTTTPANIIDNTPDTANPSIQADAIDAEIQAIDADIEADALSDTELGL